MKLIERLKASFHTNELQAGAVICLTLMNILAGLSRVSKPGDIPANWIFFTGIILFWPMLAWIGNLFSPIPQN